MRFIILWSILFFVVISNSWATERSDLHQTPDIDIALINLAWGNSSDYPSTIKQPTTTFSSKTYGLTPQEQKIWAIGHLSEEKINTARWWTILGGFGIGHSICGHWMPLSRGWIYTFVDLELLLAPAVIGMMNMGSSLLRTGAAAAGGASYTSSDNSESLIYLVTWGALFIIARVIQVIDLNITIDDHNKAYNAIEIKMGGG